MTFWRLIEKRRKSSICKTFRCSLTKRTRWWRPVYRWSIWSPTMSSPRRKREASHMRRLIRESYSTSWRRISTSPTWPRTWREEQTTSKIKKMRKIKSRRSTARCSRFSRSSISKIRLWPTYSSSCSWPSSCTTEVPLLESQDTRISSKC